MSEEALGSAYAAKDIFSGVNDSFGREISADVIDEIISSLHNMNSVREENGQMKQMLLERIQKSEELGMAASGIEIG